MKNKEINSRELEKIKYELRQFNRSQVDQIMDALPATQEQKDYLLDDYRFFRLYKLSVHIDDCIKSVNSKNEYKKYFRKYVALYLAVLSVLFELDIKFTTDLLIVFCKTNKKFIAKEESQASVYDSVADDINSIIYAYNSSFTIQDKTSLLSNPLYSMSMEFQNLKGDQFDIIAQTETSVQISEFIKHIGPIIKNDQW